MTSKQDPTEIMRLVVASPDLDKKLDERVGKVLELKAGKRISDSVLQPRFDPDDGAMHLEIRYRGKLYRLTMTEV